MRLSARNGLHRAGRKSYCTWDYQNADFDSLREALQRVDWSVLHSFSDPTEAVDVWSRLFHSVLIQYIPQKKVKIDPQGKPWNSSYLHCLARVRDRLFRRSHQPTATPQTKMAHKKVRNLYVHELRVAERSYYRNLEAQLSFESLKCCLHYWWSRLKAICGWQSDHSTPPLSDGIQVVTEPKAKAEMFNSAFSTQCSHPPAKQVPLMPRSVHNGVKFEFTVIQECDVLSVLKAVNVWKACGLDGFSSKVLQACASELAKPLAFLFNLSLSRSIYPDQWKLALVNPIYKNKGSKALPGSYRPISLLSNVSKVFGRLVKNQLLSFFSEHEVIPDEQFGFSQADALSGSFYKCWRNGKQPWTMAELFVLSFLMPKRLLTMLIMACYLIKCVLLALVVML